MSISLLTLPFSTIEERVKGGAGGGIKWGQSPSLIVTSLQVMPALKSDISVVVARKEEEKGTTPIPQPPSEEIQSTLTELVVVLPRSGVSVCV